MTYIQQATKPLMRLMMCVALCCLAADVRAKDITLEEAERKAFTDYLEQTKLLDVDEYAEIEQVVAKGIASWPELKDKTTYLTRLNAAVSDLKNRREQHHEKMLITLSKPVNEKVFASMAPLGLDYVASLAALEDPDKPTKKTFALFEDALSASLSYDVQDDNQRRLLTLKRIRVLIGSLVFLEEHFSQQNDVEAAPKIRRHFEGVNELSPMGALATSLRESLGLELTNKNMIRSARILLTRGLLAIIKQYQDVGMDIDISNENDKSMLTWAEDFGLTDCVETLKEMGAKPQNRIVKLLEMAASTERKACEIIEQMVVKGLQTLDSETSQICIKKTSEAVTQAKQRIDEQLTTMLTLFNSSDLQVAMQSLAKDYLPEWMDEASTEETQLIPEIEKSSVSQEHILDVSRDRINSSLNRFHTKDDGMSELKLARHFVSFLILIEEYADSPEGQQASEYIRKYFSYIQNSTTHLGILSKVVQDAVGLELKDKKTVTAARLLLMKGLEAIIDEQYRNTKIASPEKAETIRASMLEWAVKWNLDGFAAHLNDLAHA